ncbi:MAG TPA: PEP-CTERM sorting domain-containing protein [Acidobacteriaceae bacterium]|jgi:hypothetical protein|nr:PEP-CTERM sorting domain-containing protein [Acidobacteriaceae bacterium]
MNWKIVVLGLGLTATVGAVSAHADTITDPTSGAVYTLTYTTTGTPDVYNVYLTVDASAYNQSLGYSTYLQDVALKLFPNNNDYDWSVVDSAPTGYSSTTTPGGLNGSGCDTSGAGFFCLDYTLSDLGAPAGQGSGDIYNFEFTVEGTHLMTDLDAATVKADYVYVKNGNVKKDGADSDSITVSPAPEPSSLALLGTALLGVGLLTKKMSGAV